MCRVRQVKMKIQAVLLFFAFSFLVRTVAQDDFPDEDVVSYDQEYSQELPFDRLYSLQKYLYKYRQNRRNVDNDEFEEWKGRWMPDRPSDPVPPIKVFPTDDRTISHEPSQLIHRIPMGRPSATCDDAKTNLTIDWDGGPMNHTCYDKRIVPDRTTMPSMYCLRIPKYYVAMHKCMDEKIEYEDDVPLFGSHRPLWPVYGEYKFLPTQRWLHNLEHGAVVALYHPCANPLEVKRLKNLVAGCLRRHVITPYDKLSEDRPLAIVVWGCKLTMSRVNSQLVTRFIREHALRGPENIARDGDFVDGLLHRAETVSDLDDTILCPNTPGV